MNFIYIKISPLPPPYLMMFPLTRAQCIMGLHSPWKLYNLAKMRHYLDFYYLKQSLCWECVHAIFKYCLCRHLTGFWTGANVFVAKFECKRLLALNALYFPTFCSGITLLTVQTHTDRFLICFQRTNDDKTPLGSSCYITSALAGSWTRRCVVLMWTLSPVTVTNLLTWWSH